MKFTSENAKDIEKYFLHTYMKFPSFAGDVVHHVDGVSSSRVTGRLWNGQEEESFEFRLKPEEGPDVEFIMPVKSFFQHDGVAHFMARVPARQYRRGVCGENTAVLRLSNDGGFEQTGLSFAVLNSYVGKQAFPSLVMFKGEDSVALSPRVAVSANGTLYVDRNKVGEVFHSTKEVYLSAKLFTAEIQVLLDQAPGWRFKDKAPAKKKSLRKVSDKYGIDEEGNVVEMEAVNGEF